MITFKKVTLSSALAVMVASCGNVEINEKSTDSLVNTQGNTLNNFTCAAQSSWVFSPNNPPDEIPGGGQNLCQFYEFSWQWFISLMNKRNGEQRVYQDIASYPVFLGLGKNSCKENTATSKLFVRTGKDNQVTGGDFTLPAEMNQALGNAVIYDQNENIVLYQARFDKNMCNVVQSSPTLPAGTTEIKSSWRTITAADKANYIWITSDTNNNGSIEDTELYGMVGFHLVKSTELHPEFIWATFEHKNNAPDCQKQPNLKKSNDWSFTSKSCAIQLPTGSSIVSCNFNKTLTPAKTDDSPLTGSPTEICQVYAQGTAPGDNQADKNRGNIVSINAELTDIFNTLPDSNSLQVLRNYKIVGALWENDIKQPSSVKANQRGSIQLANTTMETNAQQGFSGVIYTSPAQVKPAANCFDCHNYTAPEKNADVSHMFKHITGK